MLTQLVIKNYALIEDIDVSFDSGFTTITGETGAGKSILLGALSLVLGKRADLSALKDNTNKCVVEASFSIDDYGITSFFEDYDLDFESLTLLRREILPSGKSRAFINDTPVTLDVLSRLGGFLVDVHSQHQTLQLTENDFQFKVIDAMAGNAESLKAYAKVRTAYETARKELERLVSQQAEATKEHDYNSFLLNELTNTQLAIGMQQTLEEEYERLNNVGNLQEQHAQADQLLNDGQIGILNLLAALQQLSRRLANFGKRYQELDERMQSVVIEFSDWANELQQLEDGIEANPQRLEEVNGKLQLLHDLMKKHQVATVEELMAIENQLAEKVDLSENIEAKIQAQHQEVERLEGQLDSAATSLHKARKKVLPSLMGYLGEQLGQLGMPSANFQIELHPSQTFKSSGKDELSFLFSANKGMPFGPLRKVASGGELSRIMLAIKALLAQHEQLPTLMFDEIDTGVSGEISNRMGEIMRDMGDQMQVFSITHLPQVASKGRQQFKVYKIESGDTTTTHMKKLDGEARVEELAEMLGGKNLSGSALAHAKQLLQ